MGNRGKPGCRAGLYLVWLGNPEDYIRRHKPMGSTQEGSRPEDSLPPSMVPNPRSQSMLRAELKEEQVREKRDRNESLRSFTMLKTQLDHRLRENLPLKSPQNH